MTAQETFDKYSNLSYLETIKFDIMYQAHTQKVQDELEEIKRTFIINIGSVTTEKSHKSLSEMMAVYKEDILLPEQLELTPEVAREVQGQNASSYHDLRGVKFTEADIIDKERLERMIEKEALPIFNSATGNKERRDFETVKFCVKQGKIAELWLIENRGYDEANKKYHDLIDKNGEYTEVKAYDVTSMNAPYIQKDIKKLRTESWNSSRWYIVFKCTHGEYEFLDKVYVK
jgi:hypothetical protein